MWLTKQDKEVKRAIFSFYYEYRKMPQDERNRLADEFLAEWSGKVDITKKITPHPATKRKSYAPSYSVADIIADFIMQPMMAEERCAEYPVLNNDTEVRREQARRSTDKHPHYHLVFDGEMPTDRFGMSEGMPPFSMDESDFNNEDPFEILFGEPDASTVEELCKLIEDVKANRTYFVNKYEDLKKDWNEETKNKKRTAKNIDNAIRKLDVSRVRECIVCGQAFYAHDWRRETCDTQRTREGLKPSECEKKYHRIHAEWGDLSKPKAII